MKIRALVASAAFAIAAFGASTAGADVTVCYRIHVQVADQSLGRAECHVVTPPAPPEPPSGP